VTATGPEGLKGFAGSRIGIGVRILLTVAAIAGGFLLTLVAGFALFRSSIPLRKLLKTLLEAVFKLFDTTGNVPNPSNKFFGESGSCFFEEDAKRLRREVRFARGGVIRLGRVRRNRANCGKLRSDFCTRERARSSLRSPPAVVNSFSLRKCCPCSCVKDCGKLRFLRETATGFFFLNSAVRRRRSLELFEIPDTLNLAMRSFHLLQDGYERQKHLTDRLDGADDEVEVGTGDGFL